MSKLQRKLQRGFTMIELVVTMILIGILSAVAIPRMNLISGFDEIGYRDQIIATLEYARKSAVAQRRSVRVQVSGNSLVFTIDSCHPEGSGASVPPCGSLVGTYTRNLILPGSNSNQISPRGSTILAGPATLVFDPLGRVTAASFTYTVTGDSVTTLTVDSGTGYVS
jgi:MSHA pilin protein MshC